MALTTNGGITISIYLYNRTQQLYKYIDGSLSSVSQVKVASLKAHLI